MSSRTKEILQCEICDRIFKRKDYLKSHMMTHTGEKPFSCTICGKSFSRKYSVYLHMRTHTSEKPHFCETCKRQFADKGALAKHRRIHTGERPFICSICGMSFNRSHHLKSHIRTHSNEKPYECSICGKIFSRLFSLTNHLRTHSGEKPYTCRYCFREFTQLAHLQQHERIHTCEKPYTCDSCGMSFRTSGSLMTHSRIHTGEQPYKCKKCGRKFSRLHSLKGHIDAEACWFTKKTAVQWERICKRIAQILFQGKEWKWMPRIPTPEIIDQTMIIPDILVRNKEGKFEIIDAKRSKQAVQYKDIEIYPKYADYVSFWCLFGEKHSVIPKLSAFNFLSSDELIAKLNLKLDNTNSKNIQKIIADIVLLKKGLQIEKNTLLTEYIKKKIS